MLGTAVIKALGHNNAEQEETFLVHPKPEQSIITTHFYLISSITEIISYVCLNMTPIFIPGPFRVLAYPHL